MAQWIRKSGTPIMECLPSILIEPEFWSCCFNPRFCGNTFWVSCSECLKYNIRSSTWSAAMRCYSMRGCSMRAPREIWSFKITNPHYVLKTIIWSSSKRVWILLRVWIIFGWIGVTIPPIRKQNKTVLLSFIQKKPCSQQRLVYPFPAEIARDAGGWWY